MGNEESDDGESLHSAESVGWDGGSPGAPDGAEHLPLARPGWFRQLLHFAWIQLQCCLFPALVFLALAATGWAWGRWDMPIFRADVLLGWMLIVQVVLIATRFETWRELGVICAFHVLGLGLEVFKVSVGSWHYPDPGTFAVAGVPLYSGFMYASVGSYICQAFRRFDLRVTRYRPWPAAALAVAAYANFFTHHFIPDLRLWIAIGFVVVLWGTRVHFTVGPRRYWMPLVVAYVLIGFFLWIAENAGTFLDVWRYPNQAAVWEMVHVGKLGSWALLVSLSFVLIAFVKAYEGELYGDEPPQVERV